MKKTSSFHNKIFEFLKWLYDTKKDKNGFVWVPGLIWLPIAIVAFFKFLVVILTLQEIVFWGSVLFIVIYFTSLFLFLLFLSRFARGVQYKLMVAKHLAYFGEPVFVKKIYSQSVKVMEKDDLPYQNPDDIFAVYFFITPFFTPFVKMSIYDKDLAFHRKLMTQHKKTTREKIK